MRSGDSLEPAAEAGAADAPVDPFGSSVAISGETVVVGAPFDDGAAEHDQGSAYVFVRSGDVWSEQQKLEASDAAYLTWSACRWRSAGRPSWSARGGRWLTGDFDQGSAYVFVRTDGVWSEQQRLKPSDAEEGAVFGHSVAINAETVVVWRARAMEGCMSMWLTLRRRSRSKLRSRSGRPITRTGP